MKRTIIAITACILLMNIGGNVSAEEIGWKRKISIGYNQANGNTEKSQLALAGSIKKVMDSSEFFSGVDVFYSESEGKMDSQKWSSTTRYSYDFGEEKRWFNSFQLLVEHDFFADVDYRILPSTGIGYWWAREDDWTLSTEAGLGYNITNYKSAQPDDESVTAYGRIFAKKQILENAFLSEDFYVYPSLEGDGTSLKSTTEFTNPVSKNMDLSVKFTVDYDTDPSAGKKNTDTLLITGLNYTF